jgi:hypothetical protein
MRGCSSCRAFSGEGLFRTQCRGRFAVPGNDVSRHPLIPEQIAVNAMSLDDKKRGYRNDLLLASAMVAAGISLSGLSLAVIAVHDPQMAQATQPMQSSPDPAPRSDAPAESKPGGERPTTPAPEPAHRDAGAGTTGATPALPPAPPEKIAPPIKER